MTKSSLAVLFIILLSVSAALAAEPQVFRNTDLEKYSGGSDAQAVEQPRPSDNSGAQRKETEDAIVAERKYWCDASTQAENRVKKAEENLTAANQKRGEAWRNLSSGNYAAAAEADAKAQKELEDAKEELAEANQERETLQGEAHQKNIPAGWLRCQFE